MEPPSSKIFLSPSPEGVPLPPLSSLPGIPAVPRAGQKDGPGTGLGRFPDRRLFGSLPSRSGVVPKADGAESAVFLWLGTKKERRILAASAKRRGAAIVPLWGRFASDVPIPAGMKGVPAFARVSGASGGEIGVEGAVSPLNRQNEHPSTLTASLTPAERRDTRERHDTPETKQPTGGRPRRAANEGWDSERRHNARLALRCRRLGRRN